MKKSIFNVVMVSAIAFSTQSITAQTLSVQEKPTTTTSTSKKEEDLYMQPANSKAEFERNYAWRIKQSKLAGVYIPVDIIDAFRELDKKTDEASRNKFKAMTEEQAEHKLYFSLGRWIISNWQFNDGSRLSHWFKGGGVSFPEDMATVIVIAYHRKLNNKDMALKDLMNRFKEKRRLEHEAWLKKQGIDPKNVVTDKKKN
jgi:hypothetical protein